MKYGSLLVCFLSIYSMFVFSALASQHEDPSSLAADLFTQEEMEYLQNKGKITMCVDPAWMPLEAIHRGKHVGMTADYFEVIGQTLPIPIELVDTISWPQSIDFGKSRQCDIFSLAMPTPERQTYMDFTIPYLSIPLVMASTMDKPFIDDITSLENVTLGVVQGYAFGELLRTRFPKMILVDVDGVNQGLQLVVEDELDGFIGTLATVGYEIQKNFPGELKVAGKFDERWELGIATRNDEPLLHCVFEKIINSLDQKTHQAILNHWISVKFEQGPDLTILFKVVIGMAIIFMLLLFKHFGLRRYTKTLQIQNEEILRQKEKLQETEKQLLLTQHAVDSCVFPIIWAIKGETLTNTVIAHANQAAITLLGYKLDEFIGLSLGDIDAESSEESWLLSIKNVVDSHGLAITTSYRCFDHSTLPVDLFISNFKYLEQNYLFLFVVDKSKQLEIEAKLHRSMKMESIGLMAGGVAHDLNNILSGIIGYPELLLMNLPKDSSMRGSVEAIKESGQRASEVVADLLTVARGVAAERKVANLNILINEYLHSPEGKVLALDFPKVELTHHFDDELLNIECSTVHVKKCLMNLVVNGAESFKTTGSILISTTNSYLEPPFTTEKNVAVGNYVKVSIKDNGKGINEEDLPHIFEPFYTKKKMGRSGTGLGLAVVWNTLEDHEGTVTVHSSEDGTVFNLYFPATHKELVASAKEIDINDIKGAGETILVVDDEEQQRDIATQMLTILGYAVASVDSGEDALDYLQENETDLVILDMIMDLGMNGRETYEQILKISPSQKAIIASGFSANDEVLRTQELGAGQLIKKPYLLNQIGKAVSEALK